MATVCRRGGPAPGIPACVTMLLLLALACCLELDLSADQDRPAVDPADHLHLGRAR